MVTYETLIKYASRTKASSASTLVRELCDMILSLEPPEPVMKSDHLVAEIEALKREVASRDARIAKLEQHGNRGRPPQFETDEERKAHRAKYMRDYRAEKKGSKQ